MGRFAVRSGVASTRSRTQRRPLPELRSDQVTRSSRALFLELLEDRILLSRLPGIAEAPVARSETLAELPVAAQQAVSSAIGQNRSAYHAASGAAGVSLFNPANGFAAQVQAGTLRVSA